MSDNYEIQAEKYRLYDRLKGSLMGWLGKKLGGRLVKLSRFALLVPDIMVLLGRLLLDSRVPRRLRIKLGMILGYLASPLDLVPEAIVGPLGFIEDIVLVAFALNRVFAEVEEEIIAEHWSGEAEHLETLHQLADLIDGIFSGRVSGKIQQWYDQDTGMELVSEQATVELVSEESESEAEEVERLRASGL